MPTAQQKRDTLDALVIWLATLLCGLIIGLILEIPSALDRTSSSPAEAASSSHRAQNSHH